MRVLAGCVLAGAAAWSVSCAGGPVSPAALDPSGAESCRWCRMAILDAKVAAQVGGRLEEPIFFDDIGCLRDYLRAAGTPRPGMMAWVADHRTGEWVAASRALYTRASIETPMGSHLIAHADAASRSGDPAASDGRGVEAGDLFGSPGPPGGEAP